MLILVYIKRIKERERDLVAAALLLMLTNRAGPR